MFIILVVVVVVVIITNKMIRSADNETVKITQNPTSNNSIKLRINEYVISNKNTFRDSDWNSPDWIELYNYGKESISLRGIYISDDIEKPDKFLLPDITLLPDEYLLVLASGKNELNEMNIEASFKLSENDEEILLYSDNNIIDIIDIVKLPTDISAGYGANNKLGYFDQPTPLSENITQISEVYDLTPINIYKDKIIINEYLSNNINNIIDNDGEHNDWIELYNPNSEPVFIGDMFLSDDEKKGDKFKLPDIELAGNEYLIIFASGKISTNKDFIHASFKIGLNDKKIILSNKNGFEISSVDVYNQPIDVSAGIGQNGEFGFFDIPTPNKANNTTLSEPVIIELNAISTSEIIINEWMNNNKFGLIDKDGDISDWIELYNPTEEDVSLNGYALSDSCNDLFKWFFPTDTIIPAHGYLLIYASSKNDIISDEIHTNFSLGQDEALYLVEQNGSIADSVALEYLSGNVSKGRVEDGYGYFYLPTPGSENTSIYVTKIDENASLRVGDIYISEVSVSSVNGKRYLSKPTYEYIELYNKSDKAINLRGYTISEANQNSYVFQNAIVASKEYFLVNLKGYVAKDIASVTTSNLSLNAAGEEIFLRNEDGVVIDYFKSGYLLGDYSSGRIIGNENKRVFFKQKTPCKTNSTDTYTSYSNEPKFSSDGGMIEENILLEITASENTTIYYTLDGNIPSQDSTIYTQPIPIKKDTIVRAVAIEEDKLPSQIKSVTFILERKHEIPIVCLAVNPYDFFDGTVGIYADGQGHSIGEYPYFESNYFKDLELPVSFEYYEENGQMVIAFDGGIQIGGGYSRAAAQKSLVVRLRDEYGQSQVDYPFFDYGTSIFKHLYLRNAGQERGRTKIKDCFIQNCVGDLGTVDMKRGRPVAVYINAQYWGTYNLRDKLNVDHLAIKYNLDKDAINLISEYSYAKAGSNKEWLELREFCLSSDFSEQAHYETLAKQVDVESFIDYIIAETFFGNIDTHNINFWKSDSIDSKWRPILFDLDISIRKVDYNLVSRYLGSSYLGFHSHIIKALVKNDDFKKQLLDRYVYVLNNIFTEEYFTTNLDLVTNEINNEMIYQVDRWRVTGSMDSWEKSMNIFREGLIERRYETVENLKEYFNLDDTTVDELFPWYKNK